MREPFKHLVKRAPLTHIINERYNHKEWVKEKKNKNKKEKQNFGFNVKQNPNLKGRKKWCLFVTGDEKTA